jgi:hypothetical protein
MPLRREILFFLVVAALQAVGNYGIYLLLLQITDLADRISCRGGDGHRCADRAADQIDIQIQAKVRHQRADMGSHS